MVDRRPVREHMGEVIHGEQHLLVLLREAQVAEILCVANKYALAAFVEAVLDCPPHLLHPAEK